ncbi:MAG TPA: ABC transporter permease [Thermoanaerobaculia bacterium]|nr:ABC transporter permease [Thermoanaerobaculia bacterium]
MVLVENFRIALAALRANALRSVLTTLGIIIGVAAVIAVVSVVQGLQHMATDVFQGVGVTFIAVDAKQPRQRGPGLVMHQVKLTYEDGQAIAAQVPGIREMTPMVEGSASVKYRDRRHRPGVVMGVNENYQDVWNHTVDRGRFFSKIDLENRRKVAVIGTKVADKLRLGPSPVGKEIYVGVMPVTVVGVMEKKGQTLGNDLDDLVLLPYPSAVELFGRDVANKVEFDLQAQRAEQVEQVRDGIKGLLRRRHHLAKGEPDDFQVTIQDEVLKQVTGFLTGATAIIGGVVAISLLVGGIGIMNIMLVSVTERTREIGVRKAVGARRRDILLQFLIEAVVLSLLGGLIGLALGYGFGMLVVLAVPVQLPPAHVPLWAIGLAFGFSALVGIFFGIYPAGKAARLDPIVALRYE